MPKSTFFRISKEKQDRIRGAATVEFLAVPYSQASINKIIKNADIPRGSFYQYFDGKEDLFEFLIHEHISQLFKTLVGELKKFNGDIFACIEYYIDMIVDCGCRDGVDHIKMLFADHQTFEIIWRNVIKEGNEGATTDSVLGCIDTSILDVEDDAELIHLIDILGIVIRDTMCKFILDGNTDNADESKDILRSKIGTLKRHYTKA